MTYYDGSPISFGDIVRIPIPGGTAMARIVMLGDGCRHLEIDEEFLAWVHRDSVLEASSVVSNCSTAILLLTHIRAMRRSVTTCFCQPMSTLNVSWPNQVMEPTPPDLLNALFHISILHLPRWSR